MSTAQRYPLSTAAGQPIPLDIIKPLGILRLPFLIGVYNARSISDIYQDKLFTIHSTEDCYVSSAAVPGAVADNVVTASILFVPAGTIVSFITNSLYLAVAGITADGTAHIQIAEVWAGISLETTLTRI